VAKNTDIPGHGHTAAATRAGETKEEHTGRLVINLDDSSSEEEEDSETKKADDLKLVHVAIDARNLDSDEEEEVIAQTIAKYQSRNKDLEFMEVDRYGQFRAATTQGDNAQTGKIRQPMLPIFAAARGRRYFVGQVPPKAASTSAAKRKADSAPSASARDAKCR
jgi:hypothetical protein